jgi:NAD(P)-dependent dehydrogenase (short-subunit alcohol dehydrogenase family)
LPISINFDDEASIRLAAEEAASGGDIDIVVVATGILHRGSTLQPEKSLRDIDPAAMLDVFRTNTIGPALVAKHFLPRFRRNSKTVFAALSARVGSIGDNRLGGWMSYRASKSALNMIVKTLSIEHARRFPGAVVAGLHPGTVDTRLSAPFQRRVPDGKLFSPQQSVAYMLSVIDRLTPSDTGGFFAWDGTSIEY